ncbi:MAG: SDR family NAD(P)-dependent oxidoreductase [Gammaproteobacteria bacterium]|jgi:NAD(P)-dependent dehydrogenase (short-subunit alcohol dehydrogenase family)
MTRFKNKTAIVTGAASGIGRATVIRLLAEGAHILAVDINETLLQELNEEHQNDRLSIQKLNIANVHDIEVFFNNYKINNSKLDALINVAGILRMENSHEENVDDWSKILNVNLTGTFFMCRYALPLLLESKGNIVNVSSTAALGAHAWTAAYSASKGGISAFSKNLAIEYGMQGLNVNCVCPASIETPMTENNRLPDGFDARLLKKIMPIDGVNRTPNEVASVIAFLASEDAIHINGVDLRVDGGLLT